jgi:hypothetical protein
LVTVAPDNDTLSAEMKASSSWLPKLVAKVGVLTVVLAAFPSLDAVASTPIAAAHAGVARNRAMIARMSNALTDESGRSLQHP